MIDRPGAAGVLVEVRCPTCENQMTQLFISWVCDHCEAQPAKQSTSRFDRFVATRAFSLGRVRAKIPRGCEVEFDGTTIRFLDQEYCYPNVKAAVSAGWLTPCEAPRGS